MREIDIAATVDWQIVDAALLDGLRDVRLACFDGCGFRGHRYRLQHALEVQTGIKRRGLTDRENNGSILIDGKIGAAIKGHFVLARRKSNKIVAPAIIGDGGPRCTSG